MPPNDGDSTDCYGTLTDIGPCLVSSNATVIRILPFLGGFGAGAGAGAGVGS